MPRLLSTLSMLLVLCTIGAGQTLRVYHIDRGYERIEEKMSNCGAHIERLQD